MKYLHAVVWQRKLIINANKIVGTLGNNSCDLLNHNINIEKYAIMLVLRSGKAVSHDKPLIFNGAMFREKLVSHHQAENEAD